MTVFKFLSAFDFTGHLQNRISTTSVGLCLTSIVFVILTGQVGIYFWKTPIHSRDPLWIKAIVIVVWVIQASVIALVSHMTILVHGHEHALAKELVNQGLCEEAIYIGANVTTICLVHGFFISRIYLLETNPGFIRISTVLGMISILEGSFGYISMVPYVTSSLEGSGHVALNWSISVWLGLSILADVSVAGSMYYTLNKGSPFVSMRLKLLVRKLTKFCIQTGLITSLITGITVALWITAQLDPDHLFMCYPIGDIYATCLMANLISRESYLHTRENENGCFGLAVSSIVFASPQTGSQEEKNEV